MLRAASAETLSLMLSALVVEDLQTWPGSFHLSSFTVITGRIKDRAARPRKEEGGKISLEKKIELKGRPKPRYIYPTQGMVYIDTTKSQTFRYLLDFDLLPVSTTRLLHRVLFPLLAEVLKYSSTRGKVDFNPV